VFDCDLLRDTGVGGREARPRLLLNSVEVLPWQHYLQRICEL